MMRYRIVLFLSACLANAAHAQQTIPARVIIQRVADNIIKNTSFKLIDTRTSKLYETTKGLTYSPDIKIESPYNEWKYWNGVLTIAMVQLGNALNMPQYTNYAKRNMDFIFTSLDLFRQQYEKGGTLPSQYQFFKMSELDDCGAMAAGVADVYQLDKKGSYYNYMLKVADYIVNKQVRLNDSTFCRPEPRKWTIWADDLYMSVPFLVRMARLTGQKDYLELAIRQVENFYKYLFNTSTGLYYHCWYSDISSTGVAQWGRCNGWVMAATTELLNYLPADHPKRSMIISLLQRHIVGVSRYQDVSGLWHQLLDKPDSYLESSCTAMFTYSIARAVNEGWIDKSYIAIAKNGWEGLSSRVNANGEVDSICVGTGVRTFIRHYYERPAKLNDIHGLGPVLLAGIEMIRAEK